jgi:hypothetical protein
MAMPYSGAGRPMARLGLGHAGLLTMPCVMVSVMPHQPMVCTRKCASVGSAQAAAPHSR